MPADDGKSGRRAGPIRTAPLDDSNKLREALQAQLHKSMAPGLMVIAGPDVGLRIRLDRSIEVGRDPTASFALRDESISWRHVRFEDRGAGEWAAVDLGSTNGMMVNGERRADAPLRNNDKVMIGKTILEFQLADAIREGFNAEVQRLLHEDELSGLWVKRRFDSQLETTVSAVRSGSLPVVSVIVMDLDGVKGINDTHGHDMGAFVIGEAGHVIGRCLEGSRLDASGLANKGFATRFGGDEFAAAVPGMESDAAIALAEAMRVAVVGHVYEKNGVRVYPGMSCGVATLRADVGGRGDASGAVVTANAVNAESLFRAADQAMYRAKRAGKNRVST